MRIRERRLTFERITPSARSSFAAKSFNVPRGFPFLWHYHPEVELTLIVEGAGLRFVGDSIERFERGEVVLLGSGLPHTWSSDAGSRNHKSVVVQFLPSTWGEPFASLPEMHAITDLLARSQRGIVFGGRARRRVEEMMRRLGDQRTRPMDRLLLLLESLHELAHTRDARTLCRSSAGMKTSDRVGRRLQRVLDRVHADILDLPPQAELARSVGMSPQAFSRFFKREVGKTFVSYVNEWRIGLATRSLIETDVPITAIAVDSGFDNLSHFNRQFRRITGLTPSAYRRQTPRH